MLPMELNKCPKWKRTAMTLGKTDIFHNNTDITEK